MPTNMFTHFRHHKRGSSDLSPVSPLFDQADRFVHGAPDGARKAAYHEPSFPFHDSASQSSTSPVSPVPQPPPPSESRPHLSMGPDTPRWRPVGSGLPAELIYGEPEDRKRPPAPKPPTGLRAPRQSQAPPMPPPKEDRSQAGPPTASHPTGKPPRISAAGPQHGRRLGGDVEATSRPQASAPRDLPSSPPLPTQQLRPAKSRLNLLNPMALLSRRRTQQPPAQALEQPLAGNLTIPAMKLPDDYDPRIRGKGVHDFSAPRPRSGASHTDLHGARSVGVAVETPSDRASSSFENARHGDAHARYSGGSSRGSPRSGDREYFAAFREDFDQPPPARDRPASDAAAPHNGSNILDHTQTRVDRSSLPPFARQLPDAVDVGPPSNVSPGRGTERYSQEKEVLEHRSPEPTRQAETGSLAPAEDPVADGVPARPSRRAGTKARRRKGSDVASSFQPAGLPKHLTSSSSRFSFDLASVGSAAQEKLLEEKHERVMAAAPGRDVAADRGGASDSDEEYMCGYDDVDDDGALEERIPGVNADADTDEDDDDVDYRAGFVDDTYSLGDHASDDDEPPEPGPESRVVEFDFRLHGGSSAAVSPMSPGALQTPRDAEGKTIGFAMSKESPMHLQPNAPSPRSPRSAPSPGSPVADGGGLGLVGVGTGEVSEEKTTVEAGSRIVQPATPALDGSGDDDDLYFDDGLIEHPAERASRRFDESVFDEEHPRGSGALRREPDPSVEHTILASPPVDTDTPPNEPARVDSEDTASPSSEDEPTTVCLPTLSITTDSADMATELPLPRLQPNGLLGQPAADRTRDDLHAYHDALARAANAAAADGKFSHAWDLCGPGDARHGLREEASVGDETVDGPGFDDDFELDDDAMVAAANAEALENDADGFYGQEFGFYAQASGNSSADSVHGGFFGPRSADGLTRSQSGHATFREPNLTPITERSEYSNRNSFMLPLLGAQPAQHHPSPGLAQLADLMSPLEGDDMSLSALMKLRRGAFGGSNGSLRSAGSGASAATSSPVSFLPPLATGLPFSVSVQGIGDSPTSPVDTGPEDEAPIIPPPIATAAEDADKVPASPAQKAECSPSDVCSIRRSGQRERGHSRTGSGAHEVSYVKEADGWVLERRRTSEVGEVEVLGREVIESGRI
ncbi:MAG: hypothetical protein M1832_003317 [Thelocarpon impressellum]|nr:MAG: hypothetical protein M1832_003317 [Thelocarpon impressellum]